MSTLPLYTGDVQGWPAQAGRDRPDWAGRSWPRFTLIIPSFNQGQYLEEAIRSVLLQGYPDLELIVIDGGSSDNSVEVIHKYEPWIAYWVSERDRGQSHAINKGVERATGELINWVNSDDWLEEHALFRVASRFAEAPETDILFGDCHLVYPGVKTVRYRAVDFDPVDFTSRISIHQPGTFWRTRLFREAGPLDETLHFCMDYDFWARIVFNHRSERLPEVLANFRRYPESKSSNFDDQTNVYREYRVVVSRLLTTLSSESAGKITRLGINANPEGIRYPGLPDNLPRQLLTRMTNRYVMTCAVQEYNLRNVRRCNALLRHCLNGEHYREAMITLAKNNLGYRRLAHPYRKS